MIYMKHKVPKENKQLSYKSKLAIKLVVPKVTRLE